MFDPYALLKNNLLKYLNKETTKLQLIALIQKRVDLLNIREPLSVSIGSTINGFTIEIDRAY